MGLLTGRSRKQYNPFKGRSGEVVLEERHDTVLLNYTLTASSGTQAFTMLQVPEGFSARILKYSMLVNQSPGSTDFYELRIDGNRLARIIIAGIAAPDGQTVSEQFTFEDAVSATNTIQIYVDQDPTPLMHNVTVEIHYVLEPTSRGYLVNT